jgi:WD40 repeat protein
LVTVAALEQKKSFELSKDKIELLQFSKDSSLLFLVVEQNLGGIPKVTRNKLLVYEVGTWKLRNTIDIGDMEPRTSVGFNEEHRLFVTGGYDGRFRLFSLENNKPLLEKTHYKMTFLERFFEVTDMVLWVGGFEFSRDGKWLATGGAAEVNVWKFERAEKLTLVLKYPTL